LIDYGGVLYAAWKGSGDDEHIWYTAYGPNGFGFIEQGTSVNQEPLPNPIASSVGPSLVQFVTTLYFAWKGGDRGGVSDTRIGWTTAEGPGGPGG